MVRVGESEKTTGPVPVLSLKRAASWAELVKEAERPRLDVATAETVLLALICSKVRALGLASVKIFAPAVVAPRLVKAVLAVVAPVPPEVIAKAFTRFKVVIVEEEMVVVARVVKPDTPSVPVREALGRDRVLPLKVKAEDVAKVLAAVVYRMVFVPPKLETPVPPLITGSIPETFVPSRLTGLAVICCPTSDR